MTSIPLTQGKVALIDDGDWELVSKYKWFTSHCRGRNTWYARTNIRCGSVQKTVALHRLIMGVPNHLFPSARVDHVNRNGLDNRRENLRHCTNGENSMNRGVPKHSSTGLKGVNWHSASNKFQARISVNRKRIHLGYFNDPKQAACVYNIAALKHHGQFAVPNSI